MEISCLGAAVWGPGGFQTPISVLPGALRSGVGRLGTRQGTDRARRAGGSAEQEEEIPRNQGVGLGSKGTLGKSRSGLGRKPVRKVGGIGGKRLEEGEGTGPTSPAPGSAPGWSPRAGPVCNGL